MPFLVLKSIYYYLLCTNDFANSVIGLLLQNLLFLVLRASSMIYVRIEIM